MFLSPKPITVFFAVLLSVSLLSQSRYGDLLSDTIIQTNSSVSGVFYAGIDNYLTLHYPFKYGFDSISLSCNNGSIRHDSANYTIIPEWAGSVRITLHAHKGSTCENFGYVTKKVNTVPRPKLMINSIPLENYCELSKDELMEVDSLAIFFSDDIVGSVHWMRVSGYELGYNYGGYFISHESSSNKFGNETRQIIQRISPNKVLTIKTTIESEGKVQQQLPLYRIMVY